MTDASGLSGLKVLVIDDSNTIRRSAEIFLKHAGCEVILAEDGFDALAKVADHLPKLIFCDILMPRLDGYQTCALIKKSAHHRDIPVVMLSSKDGLFDRARGRMVGSERYLTKPFTKDALISTVREFLCRPAEPAGTDPLAGDLAQAPQGERARKIEQAQQAEVAGLGIFPESLALSAMPALQQQAGEPAGELTGTELSILI